MAVVNLAFKAQADLREIGEFYLVVADRDVANHKTAIIIYDLKRIADNPFLGKRDKRFKAQVY